MNNIQIDDAQKNDIVMPMCNLIEYSHSNAYSKTSRSLWQYYWHEPALDNNGNIIDFLMITIIALHSNLNKKQQDKQETVAQRMLR